MKFTEEQKAAIDLIVKDRLVKDRMYRARLLAELVVERDRLVIEVANLRAELERLQHATHQHERTRHQ